jgi:pyruvate ferredoxin oxidoreductase delta subunit
MTDKKSKEKAKKGWKELLIGGLINEPGNSRCYETGSWRTFKPIWHKDTCINCLQCWINCPDAAIIVKDGKIEGIDYRYCKGCAICAEVCPLKVKAITMVKGDEDSKSADKK